MPAGQAPRLQFDHYVATEAGYDGGNVKVSVNGGAFTLVPANAYLFNPYNATMATAATNTSPLAGQAAFTGTDGGEVVGSWGTSIIQLAKLGLKSGDTFKIKYDFGRDGCGGNDGWYVDDLVLTVCKKKTDAHRRPHPGAVDLRHREHGRGHGPLGRHRHRHAEARRDDHRHRHARRRRQGVHRPAGLDAAGQLRHDRQLPR